MTVKIILTVILGGILGYFFPQYSTSMEPVISISLLLMMFFVGLDFGQDKNIFLQIKKEGKVFLAYPLLIAFGSLFGAFVAGLFLPIGILESLACGSAFGWYSLSGPLLGKLVSDELGSIAFLSNLFRELCSFFLIPIFAKKSQKADTINPLVFASGGATTMDSTLPVVSQVSGPKTTLAAFVSGAVLTILAPFLLQLFAFMLNY
ncbi:MAG TPA: lysine exporter LysO family protein [Firmicutes bacterium]|nr:lysine exporter LysO family protein [Bacillota bacterium]